MEGGDFDLVGKPPLPDNNPPYLKAWLIKQDEGDRSYEIDIQGWDDEEANKRKGRK